MKQLAVKIGVDRAVFFTLLSRVWSVAAGLITLVVISHSLSPELQGYYYTFSSLIALQIFAELGLNFAIVQFASHEMAQLTWQSNGTVDGNPQAKRRLQSLLKFSLAWFGVAAVLMLVLLIPAGLFFFSTGKPDTLGSDSLSVSWVLLVIFTAANLFITMAGAILEGCGKVAQVAIMRLWQSLVATTVVWLVLGFGGSLLALPASIMMMAFAGITLLWSNHRVFFKDILTHSTHLSGMDWRKEIWPFQWRIALSWSCGFFIFQIFNPLLFKSVGPVAAGQMGMTMQIFTAMNAAAMVWISTKVPNYGQLIATGRRQQLDALFFKGVVQSGLFLLTGMAAIWGVLYYFIVASLHYAERVLPLNLFTVLCIVSLANHIIFSEASYLRAHKVEPLMVTSVAGGLITLIMAFMLIPSFGLNGAVAAYALPTLLLGLPWCSFIFFSKRRYWAMQMQKVTEF